MKPVIDEAAALVPTLRHSVVIRNRGPEPVMRAGRDLWWHELRGDQPADAATEVMDADAPALLLFTSGTTGRSKGCTLTHCGFPTKLSLDFRLVMDFRMGDRMMWMSDMGWVVGPMVVFSSLLFNGSMVIAEGGPGMSRDMLGRAAEPFHTTKAQGTGLGLSICKRIVEAHGGSLRFESAGSGACVSFTLPMTTT